MKRSLWALCLTVVLAIGVGPVAGQMNVPAMQGGAHPAVSHGAPRSAAHSVAGARQNLSRAPVAMAPHAINSRPGGMPLYTGVNPQRNYSPFARSLNPTLAAMNARQNAQTYHVRSNTGMLARNEFASPPFVNSQTGSIRNYRMRPTAEMLARRRLPQGSWVTTPKTSGIQNGTMTPQVSAATSAQRETTLSDGARSWQGNNNRLSFSDALRCHWHEWRDRDWWCRHFTTIVFVSGGYYFLDAGYWYPAWGYDPLNSYYDYDGPIYTYGNLLPDEVIANVQVALRDAGYYFGPITGSLDVETRAALANYQRDQGLPITGAIDQPTIETLGLY
jgi:hypothetical protein